MAIVPSGKHRTMVSQVMRDQSNFGLDQNFVNQQNEMPSPPDISGQTLSQTLSTEPPLPQSPSNVENQQQDKEEIDSDGTGDVEDYVFQKLQSLGYPPRRLREFETEFVNEKLFPNGAREVAVVLPDRVYGKNSRIPSKTVNEITKDIQEKFGLSFLDGERKDKKLTLNFSSQKPEDPQAQQPAGDVLDEVYGSPAAETNKRKPKNIKASTINEMLKEGKDELYNAILENLQKGKK